MTTHPIFSGNLQTLHPKQPQTIRVLQSILDATLAKLDAVQDDIADLELDLRQARNDYAEQMATLKLAAAREDRTRLVTQAARDLRTLETLRERAGLEPGLLAMIFREWQK